MKSRLQFISVLIIIVLSTLTSSVFGQEIFEKVDVATKRGDVLQICSKVVNDKMSLRSNRTMKVVLLFQPDGASSFTIVDKEKFDVSDNYFNTINAEDGTYRFVLRKRFLFVFWSQTRMVKDDNMPACGEGEAALGVNPERSGDMPARKSVSTTTTTSGGTTVKIDQ